MAAVELILLQRVEKLGQMGDVVKVKPGYARNFLLPQKKALRASKDNRAKFAEQRAQLEAQNIRRREEAERIAERVGGLSVVIIRQAGEAGSLYGSVSARDISEAATAAGLTINRSQVVLEHPIKTLGVSQIRVSLHPEVRSQSASTSPAARKRRNARLAGSGPPAEAEEEEAAPTAENIFEGDTPLAGSGIGCFQIGSPSPSRSSGYRVGARPLLYSRRWRGVASSSLADVPRANEATDSLAAMSRGNDAERRLREPVGLKADDASDAKSQPREERRSID